MPRTGRPTIKPSDSTSVRKRLTEKVAKLAGFEYDFERYPYGGFLDVEHLEDILHTLERAEAIQETLTALNR